MHLNACDKLKHGYEWQPCSYVNSLGELNYSTFGPSYVSSLVSGEKSKAVTA